MPIRTHAYVSMALLAAALALAGCATPEESSGEGGTTQPCAPAADAAGESGHPPGTTGSGTGDITTADGGDPSRPDSDPSAVDPCIPGQTAGEGDRASTGLGEPGGGYSTAPE